jgi:hypothetical protein
VPQGLAVVLPWNEFDARSYRMPQSFHLCFHFSDVLGSFGKLVVVSEGLVRRGSQSRKYSMSQVWWPLIFRSLSSSTFNSFVREDRQGRKQ